MSKWDNYNDWALARLENARLEPDDPEPVTTCPRCGQELWEGDYVYESIDDGKYICEACFTDECRDHRKEVHEPEPDWDSMPGGWDDDR